MRKNVLVPGFLLVLMLVSGCSGGGGSSDAGHDGMVEDGGRDGSSGDKGPVSGCVEAPFGVESGVHVLRFENGAAAVSIRRRYTGPGIGESALYELERMVIQRQGSCLDLDDMSRLTYENSHHNFSDRAAGEDEGIVYELSMELDFDAVGGWKVTLVARSAANAEEFWRETQLIATGGPILGWALPSHLPVLISEFMPVNTSTVPDEAGDFDPWVELFNPSAEAVDLEGYGLTDDPAVPHKWVFAAGTSIGRHEYLVIWADQQAGQGPLHAGFRLDPAGGTLRLSGPSGKSPGEREYPACPGDHSLVLDWESGTYQQTDRPSPGQENPG